MCRKRLKVVQKSLPGLPGPTESWACLLTCTVMEVGDAADQLLDRKLNPDWRGVRESFLASLPNENAMEHWEEWYRLHSDFLQTFDEDISSIDDEAIAPKAQAYYRKHKRAMRAGAKVVWKYAFNPDHYVDALEKAMHWYFRDREAFWCELQNQPDQLQESSVPQLQAHILVERTHHLRRHQCPLDAHIITAHADVAKAVLWYEIRAWNRNSTSFTIDYGTWPQQRRVYFSQSSVKQTIDRMYNHLPTWEVRCKAAIRDLFTELFERSYLREDGAELRLQTAGIDGNDETETIKDGIRLAGLVGKLWPMHSRSFRNKTPINDLAVRDGDVCGDHWRIRKPYTGTQQYITYDTDHWKTHHRNRLIMPAESPGSITWFAKHDHRMIADHHCAETSERVYYEKQDCTIEQWTEKPGEDNHLWDVGIGNDVLGNVLGLTLPDYELLDVKKPKPKKRRRRKATVTI